MPTRTLTRKNIIIGLERLGELPQQRLEAHEEHHLEVVLAISLNQFPVTQQWLEKALQMHGTREGAATA